jgi:hypothetical protein
MEKLIKVKQASRRKYHYIYKTTCIITERFYIGMHSTDNLEDGYVGSGKRLWHSINKHGKENHVTAIIEYLKDRDSLKAREKEMVNEDLLKDPQCMNLALGGEGGASCMTKEQLSKGGKKMNELNWTDPEFIKRNAERNKIRLKELWKDPEYRNKMLVLINWTGRKHKEDSINKMKVSKIDHGKGSLNSQYNTCWIYKITDEKSIKIKNNEIQSYLDNGWIEGRKMKW